MLMKNNYNLSNTQPNSKKKKKSINQMELKLKSLINILLQYPPAALTCLQLTSHFLCEGGNCPTRLLIDCGKCNINLTSPLLDLA